MNLSNFTNSSNPAPLVNPPAPKNSSPPTAVYGATGVTIFLICGFMIYKMLKSGGNRVANSDEEIVMAVPQIGSEPSQTPASPNARGVLLQNQSRRSFDV
jgi:hypothetical protein